MEEGPKGTEPLTVLVGGREDSDLSGEVEEDGVGGISS